MYSLAKVDDDRPSFPSSLARRLFGPKSVVLVPTMKAVAQLFTVNDSPVIAVRKSLSKQAREHAIGHELGHWILRREGVRVDNEEEACDFIGAAIQARRHCFQARARETRDLKQLAFDFCITETNAALRIGEVTGEPVAVVAPHRVRARGEAWNWPDEPEIRRMARRGAPGIVRTRLQDDARRVALFAAL